MWQRKKTRQSSLIKNFENAFLVTDLDIDKAVENLNNYFTHFAGRLLKNLACLVRIMSDSDNHQALRLPLRNFTAEDLSRAARICSEESVSSDFNNNLLDALVAIKRKKRPKRKSNYSTKYFFDDDGKVFEFGKEKHARLPSGKNPHSLFCEINGRFRFGKSISTDEHFNVSKGEGDTTSISGNFLNCHDVSIAVSATTHLNMFSNDFH